MWTGTKLTIQLYKARSSVSILDQKFNDLKRYTNVDKYKYTNNCKLN